MPIKKQEFYEGAALHLLAQTGLVTVVKYEPPFFLINKELLVLLKYCTRGRSPWGFTFTPAEQRLLENRAATQRTVIGLVCGSDGVAALEYEAFQGIASARAAAIHIACYRDHGEHYEINGPDGRMSSKVAPSKWQRLLEPES